jgi:hypothetical protein
LCRCRDASMHVAIMHPLCQQTGRLFDSSSCRTHTGLGAGMVPHRNLHTRADNLSMHVLALSLPLSTHTGAWLTTAVDLQLWLVHLLMYWDSSPLATLGCVSVWQCEQGCRTVR